MGYSGVLNANHHSVSLEMLLYIGQIMCFEDQTDTCLSTGNFHLYQWHWLWRSYLGFHGRI